MKMYTAPDLRHPPKPQQILEDKRTMAWDLFPRTLVCSVRDFKTGLYQSIINEHAVGTFILDHDVGLVQVYQHKWHLSLNPGKVVAIGLGIMFDFGQNTWYVGSISMRLEHLWRGLEVVSANNPIRAGFEGEAVSFVKNNHDKPVIIRSDETLLQIHFMSVLVSPNVEMLKMEV